MAVSLNSVISFSPTAKYQQVNRANIKVILRKVPYINSHAGAVRLRYSARGKRSLFHFLVAKGDDVTTEASDKDSEFIEGPNSNNESLDKVSIVNSSTPDDKIPSKRAEGPTNLNQEGSVPNSSSTTKRVTLTARERLRAARVLSRYTETKPSKPELGNKLLEALQETDRKGKKRSGLPQAPTDMFDDTKRGLPKEGWTIEIPGGMDVFLIVFSFVFISSVMFATTYLVWKVGAIHFNEY